MRTRVLAAATALVALTGCGSGGSPGAAPATSAPATRSASPSRTPSPTLSPTPSPTPSRTATPTPSPARPATRPPATGTLRPGSRGAAVTALQQRLAALRYDGGGVTGTYTSGTAHAVTAFQKVSGLPRTGVADATTRARLATATVPRARYLSRGSGIEVDLTRQVLLDVRGGVVRRVYDVSTGRPSLPTPVSGARPFRIWRKALAGSTGYGDRERYVQYYLAGTLLAIHAYSYVPPYPASHGCVRVPVEGAARLYAATSVGEPVYTYR